MKLREFRPSDNHWRMPGYIERITKAQGQYVLLHRPDPIVRGELKKWQIRHVGLGIYELSII